jgi:hypothetical protein
MAESDPRYEWWKQIEARDARRLEDAKRLDEYYSQREKKIEARRLADLRKWQDEEMEWRRKNWGFYTRNDNR